MQNTDKRALVDKFEEAVIGITNFETIPEDEKAQRLLTFMVAKAALYKELGVNLCQ